MRKEKHLLLDEVRDQMAQHTSFIIISYSAMSANSANKLRTSVADLGGNIEMMKKRILVKAAEACGVELVIDNLPGHIGVVYAGTDPIETTKLVFTFSKENENAIKVVGGRFDGRLYNGNDIEILSKLPSKDEMRAQFLATLEAPMSQTLAVCEALLTSVIYCIDNKCKAESEAS